MKYYSVEVDENDMPYAYYRHCIYWNETEIAGYEHANGFIVQRVHYEIEVPGIGKSEDYYEAWLVIDGSCKTDDQYDDSFDLDDKFMATNLVGSIGFKDTIRYETKVYWIDRIEDAEAFGIIQQWKNGGARMANELKSAYVKDYPDLIKKSEKCQREFIHYVDCTSDESVQLSVEHFYSVALQENKTFAKERIKELLEDTEYRGVIDSIVAKYNL